MARTWTNLKYVAHVLSLVLLIIGSGIAFWAIRVQATRMRIEGQNIAAIFVDISAWLLLILAAFANQYVAYRFYQPE